MDKFSELIAKGVAAFRYESYISDTPQNCLICRMYNNTFGAATDTHMSAREDGTYIITGHMLVNKKEFDKFMCMPMYGGVNFIHSGNCCFAHFLQQNQLKGRYDIVNGDDAYILTPYSDEEGVNSECPCEEKPAMGISFVTTENSIPQNSKYITTTGMVSDIQECYKGTPLQIAENLNKSRYVQGYNWMPVYTSEGLKMTCMIGNKIILLS